MRITHMEAGGDLTVHSIRERAAPLIEAVRSARQVHINLQGVSRVDTAGVQLLLLLCREAQRASSELRFVYAGDAVQELLNLYRADDVLERIR